MRVLILSDTEASHGGSIATTRLAEGLLGEGVEVHRAYAYGQKKNTPWVSHPLLSHLTPLGDVALSLSRFALSDHQHSRFLENLSRRKLSKLIARIKPDVINIHTMFTTGWGIGLLEVIPPSLPQAWTLHEMWSFTGACDYSYHCDKFATGCDAACATENLCPGVQKHLRPDEIKGLWERKRAFRSDRSYLAAIAPSLWLKRTAERGLWRDKQLHHIPYGLNLEQFHPVDRAAARAVLGLPADGLVMLLTATDLKQARKGAHLAVEALKAFPDANITVLTLGYSPLKATIPGVTLRHLGFVSSELLQAAIYSAADLTLHAATEDNLPNTVLESLACGTPVAGFNIGGVPDMVIDGTTGWLAKEVTVAGYVDCLRRSIQAFRSGSNLRQQCRAKAERDYPLDLQAKRYVSLFNELMTQKPA